LGLPFHVTLLSHGKAVSFGGPEDFPHVIHSLMMLQSVTTRPHHSTSTALNLALNNIYASIDSGHPTLLVSLDLSVAFDTIKHIILLSSLSSTL
jgi:hypothetical protein